MTSNDSVVVKDLVKLDGVLSSQSYIVGFTPSCLDVMLYKTLAASRSFNLQSHVNILRWYNHIASFTTVEINALRSVDNNNLSIEGVSFTRNLNTSSVTQAKPKKMVQKKVNEVSNSCCFPTPFCLFITCLFCMHFV